MTTVKHFDTSIVVPYVSALIGSKEQRRHPDNKRAKAFIENSGTAMKISVVTFAETMRHFNGSAAAAVVLEETFDAPLPIGKIHARRWARLQNRSDRMMGDNDAWVAAQAVEDRCQLVGHDKEAFHDRPDLEYIDFLKH